MIMTARPFNRRWGSEGIHYPAASLRQWLKMELLATMDGEGPDVGGGGGEGHQRLFGCSEKKITSQRIRVKSKKWSTNNLKISNDNDTLGWQKNKKWKR